MPELIVYHMTVILVSGLAAAWICKKLKFSMLIGFLLIGTIIGPGCLDLTGSRTHKEHVEDYINQYVESVQKDESPVSVTDDQVASDGLTAGEHNSAPLEVEQEKTGRRVMEKILVEEAMDAAALEGTAELGVLLLLFAIGLEFSLDKLAAMAKYMFVGGSLQMALCIAPIAGICRIFGMSWEAGIVIGCVIALSSTALVYKSMGECEQADTKRGRATLGVLLFQDVALVPMLLLIPLLFSDANADNIKYWGGTPWFDMPAKSLIFCSAVVFGRPFIGKFCVPRLIRLKANDLLILFAVVVLLGMCTLARLLDLTPALGALAAGLMLGENRLTHQIDALVLPFRETFSAIFFISLGMLMDFSFVFHHPVLCVGTLALVVLFKCLASSIALISCGMDRKSAFGFGLSISQVGELAFMLLAIAYSTGAFSETVYKTFLFVSVASLVITPNMVRFALSKIPHIEEKLEKTGLHPLVKLFLKSREEHAIVIGIGHIGARLVEELDSLGKSLALIDYNPMNLQSFAQNGLPTFSGDGSNPELLEEAGILRARLVVVVVPDDRQSLNIVRACRELNRSCTILARVRYSLNIGEIKRAGAQTVICEEANVCDSLIQMIAEEVPCTQS